MIRVCRKRYTFAPDYKPKETKEDEKVHSDDADAGMRHDSSSSSTRQLTTSELSQKVNRRLPVRSVLRI